MAKQQKIHAALITLAIFSEMFALILNRVYTFQDIHLLELFVPGEETFIVDKRAFNNLL